MICPTPLEAALLQAVAGWCAPGHWAEPPQLHIGGWGVRIYTGDCAKLNVGGVWVEGDRVMVSYYGGNRRPVRVYDLREPDSLQRLRVAVLECGT